MAGQESLQAQYDKNVDSKMNQGELLKLNNDLNNPNVLKDLKNKMQNDPDFKRETVAFLKSFEKTIDYGKADKVDKNKAIINNYNNVMFKLLGNDVFKFDKENVKVGPDQQFKAPTIPMKVGTMDVKNAATINSIKAQLDPILTGLKNGTIEITSGAIDVVGMASALPNTDQNGTNVNPMLAQQRSTVAGKILQDLGQQYGVDLPLTKFSTRLQPQSAYDPNVDINKDVPKFNDWHGVKFEFTYRTVTSSPNLPSINIKTQLENKTLDGKHIQAFQDMIDESFLNNYSQPVQDQLKTLKDMVGQDTYANTMNLLEFVAYLGTDHPANGPIATYSKSGRALVALQKTEEGKKAVTLLKNQLLSKDKALGGGALGLDTRGTGAKQNVTFFGSLGSVSYDAKTKTYTPFRSKVAPEINNNVQGYVAINNVNYFQKEREQVFSTMNTLNVFLNEQDLKNIGAQADLKITNESVDMSKVSLDKLLSAYQEKQVNLIQKESGGAITFDLKAFAAEPSTYYATQLDRINGVPVGVDKSLLNMYLNNLMLAEVNKQKIDRARKNGYLT